MRTIGMVIGCVAAGLFLPAGCGGEKPVSTPNVVSSTDRAKDSSADTAPANAASEEAPDLDAAIFQMKSKSFHFVIERAGGETAGTKAEGDISRKGLDHRMRYTVTGAADPADNGEWITMESKVYQKPDGGRAWKEVSNAAVRSMIESAIFIKQEDMEDAKPAGTETVEGKQAHHFTRKGKFATNAADYDFWVEGENIVKCRVKSENGVTYTTVFSNFGSVGEIEKPV